ncbi:MAG TPA: leucine--tRNA ligase [Bacteroidales bacterium]|nr:leucine--tRNA ligase [Bacteroidales bacterium]
MEYNFKDIELKWQKYWSEHKTFKAGNTSEKPKFYVLDMFPYPSGAGLHVGHPLGYIASDVYARYMRLKGYNVLHPMGYDAFGLPAEQYAIQTGTHPEITTRKNIERYRSQMDRIGFSYDWDREIRTCDPSYYKWTQWTFIQLFHSWYDKRLDKARPISELIEYFSLNGNNGLEAASGKVPAFSAEYWNSATEKIRSEILMEYRLAYQSETIVNWCPELGTVLANDEVSDGLSVRGGHPVERVKMKQWLLRITAYAERLLQGLERIDWNDSIKDIQRNWIGKSEGCTIFFKLAESDDAIEIFTTRPDTIFGATFMVLSPEHPFAEKIITPSHFQEVSSYLTWAKNRSELERMMEVKKVTGVFTGTYAINPFTNKKIPVWIADYVLAGYGTGAIMAVPAHDSRDFVFARHFQLPIIEVVRKPYENQEILNKDIEDSSYDAKEGIMINSGFLNGLDVSNAIRMAVAKIEEMGIGYKTVHYRLRDAIFSRQRYWGEPFPVYYKDGIPYTLPENELPLELPLIDAFLPTQNGEPPLARAKNWNYEGYPLETNTMPGFAGSSGYYFRYMDPHNNKEYFSHEAVNYWRNVDLYIGGSEHATGHLIYSRFWCKFLYDIGLAVEDEPFQKLINQGMIQGRSSIAYRIKGTNTFVSFGLKDNYDVQPIHVDIHLVENDILDLKAFKKWRPDLANAEFILENGKYICGFEIEKMSKSLHNVQNPDELIDKYGADTLRLYEMFLGPLEQSKPWDTKGIEGVFRFLRKFWKLFHDDQGHFYLSEAEANEKELKILHRTIKKVKDDIERYSFNTVVSAFMIATNELTDLKCNKREILEPLIILISPYAPHIAEELWELSGHTESITYAQFPEYKEEYLIETSFNYPVSFNGKVRYNLTLPLHLNNDEIEQEVLRHDKTSYYLQGKMPKKIIIVRGKIINVVF